jgi:hypothetical protein|tara:strand:+ start:14775 stop:15866 length:1092 start_codon:yes stop_codon:yes gene_type:complete
MPESLTNQFISDFYTSLLHLSGAELSDSLNNVFDGVGNSTGLALSGKRVVINNYIYPEGPSEPSEWLDAFFPIGCIQLTLDDINPQTRIAGTTWVVVAEGKFLVGVGGHTDKNNDYRKFCEASKPPGTGNLAGEFMTELTVANLPPHRHDTNVGAGDVFVSEGAGIDNGQVFQATGVGTTNSTVAWSRQQRFRNQLGAAAGFNFANDFGNRFSDDGGQAPPNPQDVIRRSLDLNFMLGSAATWSEGVRDLYMNNEIYQYKEVIGLWNGETRFVASVIPEGAGPEWDFNAYEFCLELGAVDVGAAQAGELAVNQSVTPVIVRGTEQINFNEGATNIQESTEVGEGTKHNNIPPSYGIYVWQRVA